jgi:hypothetical protein
MRRPPALTCALALTLALAVAACSSDEQAPVPTGSTAPSAPPPSPTLARAVATTGPATGPSGSPAPLPQPDVRLPGGMSDVVDDPADLTAIGAGDLTALLPPASTPATSATLTGPQAPIDRIAVTWRAGEPPSGRTGLIVWQRAPDDQAWRAVYAFTDPAGQGRVRRPDGPGDLTHDGIADLLTFEDQGGSGACGTFRVVASTDDDATEILRRSVCDTEIQIAGGDLRTREAVFGPDDPHCCPSAFRTTVLRWDRQRLGRGLFRGLRRAGIA